MYLIIDNCYTDMTANMYDIFQNEITLNTQLYINLIHNYY